MADEDDQDDPVTEEIDVYLAKNLEENLYLFQYPTRPAAVTYDKKTCLAARVKPNQHKIMLEMSLNTAGPSYCTSKGEQFAYEVDHGVPDDKKFFKSDKMDKQVLLSSQGTMSTSQYAVGLLKDGELHLTPLQGIVQLRPNFEYVDRAKDKKASAVTEEGDSQDEEEAKATALSVRFAKKESEHSKAQRLLSYKHLEKKLAEEQWTDVQYYGRNDAKSIDEKEAFLCQEMNFEVLEFDPSPSNYMDVLMPSSKPQQDSNSAHLTASTTSMAHVRKLELVDQIKTLLVHAKLMSFPEICGLLYPPANELAVLKCVQQHALLVQGCWVVKSELLYPRGTNSPFSTATAETLCKGRDYILYKFTQSRSIQRNEIIPIVKLTTDDVDDIIKQVAKRNAAVGWEFKMPYDKDFVERFNDVAKQQKLLWSTKYRTLCDKLKIKPLEEDRKDDAKSKKIIPTVNHEMEKLINHAMNKQVDFPNDNDAATLKNGEQMELSPEDQDKLFNRLVKFVKTKLNTSSLSLADFKKLILLHQTAVSPGDILSLGVSDALLLKAISKCGGEEIDLKWPTSSHADLNSRRIFVVRNVDSPMDKYRSVILDLFDGSFGVQRKTIMEKTKEVLGSSPSSFEYGKVIQELGLERKGNSWHMRGTLSTTAGR